MTEPQARIVNRCIKATQEQVAWAQHELDALSEPIPPTAVSALYSLGTRLQLIALDKGEEMPGEER